MHHSLALISPISMERTGSSTQLTQRLVLYPSELYRVPADYGLLRIKAGAAYVTHAGHDHILYENQELPLAHATDRVLVSSLGNEPVIFELFAPQTREIR